MKRLLGVLALVVALPVMADSCGPPAGSSSSAPAVTKVSVGTAMKSSEGLSVTVASFKRNVAAPDFVTLPAGKECVQVNYVLVNGSKSEWSAPTIELKLVDANGQTYDTLAFECPNGDNVSSLVASGHANATEYYEVPKGIALAVVWQPDIFASATFQTPLT